MTYYTTKRCWYANRFYEAGEEVPATDEEDKPDFFVKQEPAVEETPAVKPSTLADLSKTSPPYDPGKPGKRLRKSKTRVSDTNP